MEEWLLQFFPEMPLVLLFTVIAAALAILSKGADMLVDEAVSLSVRWGIPKVIVGATIVSLGTTLPEVTVSVAAAFSGNAEIALGNGVGSIICNTSLIIGIAALIRPLPVQKSSTGWQSTLNAAAGILLVVFSFVGRKLVRETEAGSSQAVLQGSLPRWTGFLFLVLLVGYLLVTIRISASGKTKSVQEAADLTHIDKGPITIVFLKLILGLGLIIVSSKILLPAVQVTARRLGIPDSIIAATLIAFGTSLPELITAVQASRKGHGELAIGNVLGADILNVLFVIGASTAVTVGGLSVPSYFYWFHYPVMLAIVFFFKFLLHRPSGTIGRVPGIILLAGYAVFSIFSYVLI